MNSASALKSPFPYFGGKGSIVKTVWHYLGNPRNYIEQFCGTAINLLRRPERGAVETINDSNHYVANFWRATQQDPDAVAYFADNPVSEADLRARHLYLTRGPAYKQFLRGIIQDPDFYDSKFAGWWCWGQCCWIGGGWCTDVAMKSDGLPKNIMPEIGIAKGVAKVQLPDLTGHSGATGRGVAASAGHNKNRRPSADWNQKPACEIRGVAGRPQLGDAYSIGRGVNSNDQAGTCETRRQWLRDWMYSLADRLRMVRVCYGHWNRICNSNTTMTRLGETGSFLDPPYAKSIARMTAWRLFMEGKGPKPVSDSGKSDNRASTLYGNDNSQDVDHLVAEVNLWCQRWGANPSVRIVLCGYDGEHNNLVDEHGWRVESWKAHGGYANRNAENTNNTRERLWISPACQTRQKGLFE